MGRSMWVLIALLIISFALAGCGGSGGTGNVNGNGNGGSSIDPSISLIGVWQPTSATEDGTIVKLSSAMMNWDDSWSYGRMEFRQNGTCYIRGHYGNNIDLVEGTWESEEGISQVTFEGETTEITWSETGNVMTVNFTRDGHDYETKWIRITDLTEQEPDFAKTWRVDNVVINGVDTDPADYFDFEPGSDEYIIQLLSNGDMLLRELASNEIIDSEVGSWATGGQVVMFYSEDDDEETWGYIDGDTVTYVDEDGDGDTVTLELSVWPPAGNRDSALVGVWKAASATVNGVSTSLADAMDWEPGVTSFQLQLWEDGTSEAGEYAGSVVQESWLGDWHTVGDRFTLNEEETVEGPYTIVDQSFTFSFEEDGDIISIEFDRIIQ